MRLLKTLLAVGLCSYLIPGMATINHYFKTISNNPKALYAFLKEMPKGGELHYHLAGGAYTEAMIQIAADNNYCLKKSNLSLTGTTDHCKPLIEGNIISKNHRLYQKVLRAWSMKDFKPGRESGHDHFFNSFAKFIPLVFDKRSELLVDIMQRAAEQHEQYMEIMILPDNGQSTRFACEIQSAKTLTAKKIMLLHNRAFMDNVHLTIQKTNSLLKETRKKLGCNKNPKQAVCGLTIKFQYYVLREQPLDQVFSQALNGFIAASQSSDLIAVNLVQPEDGPVSLRDYRQQMEIFQFLHKSFPKVHVALHAGELVPGLVKSQHLRSHIHDAIKLGTAERIGHGVDIRHEDKADDLLDYMAKKHIPVEINLGSNRQILSLYGKKHPLHDYLSHQVPVVLSTDDEGILRTDLTREYMAAVRDQNITYEVLKQINRNTLTYSFLPGKSIWANAATSTRINACKELNSISCKRFVASHQKARQQWLLEKKLTDFEQRYLK